MAGVWLWVCCVGGCTDGISEPFSKPDGAVPQNVRQEGGASGPEAGSSGGTSNPRCPNLDAWPQWLAEAENGLRDQVDYLIEKHAVCAASGKPLNHDPFTYPNGLRCQARAQAMQIALAPARSPTSPKMSWPPIDQVDAQGQKSPAALDDLAASQQACKLLNSPEYGSLGIGRYADTWVLKFAH